MTPDASTAVRAPEDAYHSARVACVGVAIATGVGLAIRLGYILGPARDRPLVGDATYYHGLARVLADGHGFIEPLVWVVSEQRVETATHPPLFPLLLALPTWLGVDTPLGHRVITAVLGLLVVPLIGLAAFRLAGPVAAIGAATLAAVNPAFWMNDVNVLSEALVAPLVAAVMLYAIARPRNPVVPPNPIVLGALIGLATLARPELALLLALLALPLLRRQVVPAVVAFGVVIAPWVVYNLSRFEEPVFLSNNLGGTLSSASCDSAWYGERTGWWEYGCEDRGRGLTGDESERDRALRRDAADYIGDHLARAPVVAAARIGRVWDVYRPVQTADFDGIEGRGRWPPRLGLAVFAIVVALAATGIGVIRRDRVWLLALTGPLVLVTVVAATFYGSPRFRVPADVALTIAAGAGIQRALFATTRRVSSNSASTATT
jgi:4-amino-4-deoxy-L-arabinose transferase-like glycosyltransferase